MRTEPRQRLTLAKARQAEGSDPWPPPTIMKPVVLSPQQRWDIERRRKESIDRRVYQRLTAVLTIAEGKSREEVAHLLGIGLSQLGEWLRVYRNKGLDALCILHYKGDPGKLTAGQVEQLKEKVSSGCFRSSDQIRQWLKSTFC